VLTERTDHLKELDGAPHLSDAQTYRRDRRKDALLQENGYSVIRFLAEDLSSELDAVLDSILRALAHRGKTFPRPVSTPADNAETTEFAPEHSAS